MLNTLMTLQYLEKVLTIFSFSMAVLLVCIGLFILVGKVYAPSRSIYLVPLKKNQRPAEFLFNVLFMIMFSFVFAAILEFKLIHFGELSWKNFLFTFIGMTATFDTLYYFAHKVMHKKQFSFMHARHHVSQVNTPFTAFSLGPFEVLVWIFSIFAFPVAFARSGLIVAEGMLSYFVFLWFINVWGHCNVETMSKAFSNAMLSTFCHPNTYHALHHARYAKNHSFLFTTFLDRMFNQVWADWKDAHERVLAGKPMTKLTERVRESK